MPRPPFGGRIHSRYFSLMEPLSRIFVVVGILLVALGVFLHFGPSVPLLGKLPGDIRVERPGFRFYFPITSSLLLSVLVSGLFWLLSKVR